MQVVGRHCESAIDGCDLEFAPQCVDVFLLVVKAGELHEVVAGCGMGAISPYQEVKVDLNFRSSFGICGAQPRVSLSFLKPGFPMLEVGSSQLVIEKEGNIW
jgi:hypothetical protein